MLIFFSNVKECIIHRHLLVTIHTPFNQKDISGCAIHTTLSQFRYKRSHSPSGSSTHHSHSVKKKGKQPQEEIVIPLLPLPTCHLRTDQDSSGHGALNSFETLWALSVVLVSSFKKTR